MVYISSDGSIGKKPQSRNPLLRAKTRLLSTSPQTAIIIATIAILCSKSSFFDFGPLANGKIPATKRGPSEHWSFIENNLGFVRTMTKPLHHKTKATSKEGKKRLQDLEMMGFIDDVDFGGPDGHVAESTSLVDLEEIRVTRCSTSQSAVTAYMCGAEKALDSDAALGLYERKMWNFGTASFRGYLKCRHDQGEQNGNHRRSVYRLRIGCKDSLAGYSHAFSIVSQPDGTYFWLQSFIGHYSLSTWMKKKDDTKESGLAGVLTYDELMAKLDAVDRLMNINDWTPEANDNYLDLFNVDKTLERVSGNHGMQLKKWDPDHRLDQFTWDEACEYPLPEGYELEGKSDTDTFEHVDSSPFGDTCSALLLSSIFNHLKLATGDLTASAKDSGISGTEI